MPHRLKLLAGPAAALALLAPPAPAQQPGDREGRAFTGETSVLVVEIPVQVTKDGKPVRGLTAENFAVLDGKARRPLSAFEVIDVGGAGAAGAGGARPALVPAAARRHFLLVFDLAFSSRNSLAKAEAAARSLLAAGDLHPRDLIGVAFYSPTRGLVFPFGFSTDRAQVERVLDALAVVLRGDEAAARRQLALDDAAAGRGGRGGPAARDPLGLTAGDFRSVVGALGSLSGMEIALSGELLSSISSGANAKAIDLLANALSHMSEVMTPFVTEARRSQVAAMSDDFATLAWLTRDLEGRKHLVFFSDGFDDAMLFGDYVEQRGAVGGGRLLGNARTMQDLGRMVEELRRSGWVMHSVEAFGHAGQKIGSEGLFYMANETGGTFFRNRNDLGEAMGDLLVASSVTYLLSFQADEVPPDGAFHPVRVELVGAPRGARLSHKAGYHAPLPPSRQSAAERRVRAADLVVAGEPRRQIPLSLLAVPFRHSDERAYVPVVVEVDGAALAPEAGAGGLALELYAYAFDSQGRVQDAFGQQLRLDAARAAELGAGGVLRFVGDLLLPGGEHELRLLLRGVASGRTTLEVVPVVVPSPAKIAKRLLPPFFVAGGGAAMTVREAGAETTAAAYPFRVGEQAFVPTARPALGEGEETRLFLAGYQLAAGDLRVSGRVLSPDGAPVPGGVLTGVGRLKGEGELDRVLATFRPSGLAPGDYRLEVTLAEPGGAALRAAAPFRVVPPSP